MNFRDFLSSNFVYLDGGMGTLLQAHGLRPGEHPELWNIDNARVITDIHRAYYDAGSNVVCTNTFGANCLKFSDEVLDDIIRKAIINAKIAREQSYARQEKFIALDVGPTGRLLKPLGDLDFEDAVSVFSKTISLGTKYGVDLIVIETMNDCYETKAALLAAKECCDLPVIVTNAYGEDGKLMTGASPAAMVTMLEAMGADAIGANCSLGPRQLKAVVEELLKYSSVPVVLKPNAGLPREADGKTVFDVSKKDFSIDVANMMLQGVRVVGGCCGTTPEYIRSLHEASSFFEPSPIIKKGNTLVSSYTHAVEFGSAPILIGERINPTGKKRFKQALIDNDMDYILTEAASQQDKGVHILDVNVGLPDIDEKALLRSAIFEIQSISNLPLQIDSSDPVAMEQALRIYNGKAMINSVNGKAESMAAVFPLVKKYGGVVVALTLDESGIPNNVEGRFAIAEKILKCAESYGIDKKDIVFDTLAMTISADADAAVTCLSSLRRIRAELGCQTILGVSNISFGLPARDIVNSTFFALALENGLSAAIMNPYSAEMMKVYYAYMALKGYDKNCTEYILASEGFVELSKTSSVKKYCGEFSSELQKAVIKGFKDKAAELTKSLIAESDPLELVNSEIIPALNVVGQAFENKTMYLPQLLMSAEAAKSAFEVIKASVCLGSKAQSKSKVVVATVHGDIHDIGKNIVKMLLENYGYN